MGAKKMDLPEYVYEQLEIQQINAEIDEEIEYLKSDAAAARSAINAEMRNRDAKRFSERTKNIQCAICGVKIVVERVSTTQAVPKYCHKVSCAAKGKAINNKASRARRLQSASVN